MPTPPRCYSRYGVCNGEQKITMKILRSINTYNKNNKSLQLLNTSYVSSKVLGINLFDLHILPVSQGHFPHFVNKVGHKERLPPLCYRAQMCGS